MAQDYGLTVLDRAIAQAAREFQRESDNKTHHLDEIRVSNLRLDEIANRVRDLELARSFLNDHLVKEYGSAEDLV